MARRPDEITQLHRGIGRALAIHREASPRTQSDLARLTHYSRTSISHIEAGRQFPIEPEFWETVDQALGANGALVAQYEHIRGQELQLKHEQLEEDHAARRTRAAQSASAWSPPTPAVPAPGAKAETEQLRYALVNPSGADLVAVAQLREQVHALDVRYDRCPSTSLIAGTGQCLGRIAFLQSHASASRVRRELWAVEAEAATLMGQLVWDASQRRDHTAARAYFRQAAAAARRLQAPSAEGLALLRTSYVALYGEKDPRAGLRLTRQAADAVTGASDVLAGLAVLHTAEAHAMLNEQMECERALSDAEVCFGRVDQNDPAIDLFSPTQQGRLAGSCYLFLGDFGRAQQTLTETAEVLTDGSKSQAIVLGNLSLTYIRQRKLDEAAATLHQAIDIVEQTWGGGGLNVAFGAAGELRQWRTVPVVEDVYDRLLTLMTAS